MGHVVSSDLATQETIMQDGSLLKYDVIIIFLKMVDFKDGRFRNSSKGVDKTNGVKD